MKCGNPMKLGESTPPIGIEDPAGLAVYGILHPGCRRTVLRERMRAGT